MELRNSFTPLPIIAIVATMLLIPALFHETTLSMVSVWSTNETFTHGFLVLPISLWLVWSKKSVLGKISPSPTPLVLIPLLGILFVWVLGNAVDVKVVQHSSMVALIPTLVWLLLGTGALLSVLFPVLFLFFAVPLGQELIPVMMEFTANFVVVFIRLLGIPIYQDGLYFILPTGTWSVVEECSGVRYLIASVSLGTIYAYLNYNSARKRILFIAVSIITPVIANGLRAFGIVLIGHFSGMKLAVGVDHLVYGWVFFGIVIFLLFYAGSFWWDPTNEDKDTGEVHFTKETPTHGQMQLVVLALASLAIIFFTKLFAYQITTNKGAIAVPIKIELPEKLGGWRFDPDLEMEWKPQIVDPDALLNRVYRTADSHVQLDLGYYHVQRNGAEAVTNQNRLTDPYGGDWKIIRSGVLTHEKLSIRETEILRNDRKLLVWSWYLVGEHLTENPYFAKALDAYNVLVSGRNDVSILNISTAVDDDAASARTHLQNFYNSFAGIIYRSLNALHDSTESAQAHRNRL